jgi:putative ABC transport system substrate-binding protein
MRRREFIAGLGGTAAWPLSAYGQHKFAAVIGFVHSGSLEPSAEAVVAFREGLRAQGYIEGQNLVIEYRWAHDQYERLPSLIAELLERQVSLVAATGGPVVALAAKKATTSVPIIFTAVADPVRSGLVASLNRPGGNVTGTAGLTTELDPKRLDLLREVLPIVFTVGVLINPNRPGIDAQLGELMAAEKKAGMELVVLRAGTERELEAVVADIRKQRIDAVLVTADPFFVNRRETLVRVMSQASVPAIYQWREMVLAGGLISYGPSRAEAYYDAGVYAGRILKGERPAELPVLQPTKFELVINLRTAKSLGMEIPPTLLARAESRCSGLSA